MMFGRFVLMFMFWIVVATTGSRRTSSFSIYGHGTTTTANGGLAAVGAVVSPSGPALEPVVDGRSASSIRTTATRLFSSISDDHDDQQQDRYGCGLRSNSTHIVWTTTRRTPPPPTPSSSSRVTTAVSSSAATVIVQTRREAEQECLKFLRDNLMPFDHPFMETLGFPPPPTRSDDDDDDDDGEEFHVDGLDRGLIGPTIRLALDAKVMYPWTDQLPQHIFFDYVLNYANLNEARTNWRPLLVDALKFNESELYLSGNATVTSATDWVNHNVWKRLGKPTTTTTSVDGTCSTDIKPIFFKSGQTPLIFDPMSTIAFGYASCTGISILFCNALRAVGIPARVVGTPAWYGNRTNGNHNWVEVYVGDSGGGGDQQQDQNDNDDDLESNVADEEDEHSWKFLEGLPANPGDALNGDPCQRWFCDPSRYPSSKVYAAKMSHRSHCGNNNKQDQQQQQQEEEEEKGMTQSLLRPTNGVIDVGRGSTHNQNNDNNEYVPLAWEWDCTDVPAVDRTDYYTKICHACPKD